MNEKALKPSHPDVDRLICKKGRKIVAVSQSQKSWGRALGIGDELGGNCDGKREGGLALLYNTEEDPGLSSAVAGRGKGMWPEVSRGGFADSNVFGWEQAPHDSSQHVSTEITDMGPGDKAIVAGFLAKTEIHRLMSKIG